MKNQVKILSTAAVCLALGATVITACKKSNGGPEIDDAAKSANSTITAQSFMIDIQGNKEIVIKGNEVWHFNELSAAIADFGYNNCDPATSGPNNGNQCRSKALNDAKGVKCNYWDQAGHPHWVLYHSNVSGDTTAPVTLDILIAGESFMRGGQFKDKGKYSFTLRNPDGSSRITNLSYSIDGETPVAITHTVIDGNSGLNNCYLDLVYNANCGPYGNSAAFSYLKTGTTIKDILWSDDTNSNDAGCPATSVGVTGPLNLTLKAGNHTITFFANVKGNDGQSDVTISKSVQVHISAESCQN